MKHEVRVYQKCRGRFDFIVECVDGSQAYTKVSD